MGQRSLVRCRAISASHCFPRARVRASANVCQAAGCLSMSSDKVFDQLREAVLAQGLDDVAVRRVGCLGLCAAGPLVEVPERRRLFEHVQPGEPEVISELVDSLAGESDVGPLPFFFSQQAPFFSQQVKVVLERCGRVDPERLEDTSPPAATRPWPKRSRR